MWLVFVAALFVAVGIVVYYGDVDRGEEIGVSLVALGIAVIAIPFILFTLTMGLMAWLSRG